MKILHIGNVANYAYNIAKIVQTSNITSHAISWDYYHINSRPVWEEGNFESSQAGDHFFPALPSSSKSGFKNPEWYVQGPRVMACLTLIAANEGKRIRARLIGWFNKAYLRLVSSERFRTFDAKSGLTRFVEAVSLDLVGGFGRRNALAMMARRIGPKAVALVGQAHESPEFDPARFETHVESLIESYRAIYPDREFDPILLRQYAHAIPLVNRLLGHYDLIVAYAIEGIWPLMAQRPYVAYEFGTIRNLPFQDTAMGRLASLVYRNSEATIVTNSDNEAPAKLLGRPYFFLPHVINEGCPDRSESSALRDNLVSRHGGSFYIFHPPRQHWDETRDTNWDKGNDRLFRGFAAFVRGGADEARCIAVSWGQTLEKSRALVAELGVEDKVIWIEPQPHRKMMAYIGACDVVADQFTIQTFGGIPPKAFHAGKPVITAFDPDLHSWCYGQMPPLLRATSDDEVRDALHRLRNEPGLAERLARDGAEWYRRFNSNDRILSVLLDNLRLSASGDHGRRV